MSKNIDVKDYLKVVGTAMDWDALHDVYGAPQTEVIPWLHKKPTSYTDTFEALYSYLRDSGVTVTFEYNPEEVDIDRMLLAASIRKRESNGE